MGDVKVDRFPFQTVYDCYIDAMSIAIESSW